MQVLVTAIIFFSYFFRAPIWIIAYIDRPITCWNSGRISVYNCPVNFAATDKWLNKSIKISLHENQFSLFKYLNQYLFDIASIPVLGIDASNVSFAGNILTLRILLSDYVL